MGMISVEYWLKYFDKIDNYECLEKECGTDPKIFENINLDDDYWGLEDNLYYDEDYDNGSEID